MNKILVLILLIVVVGIVWFVSLHNSTEQELSVAEQTVLEDFKLLQEEISNTVTTLPAPSENEVPVAVALPAPSENEEPVASAVVTRAPVVAPVVDTPVVVAPVVVAEPKQKRLTVVKSGNFNPNAQDSDGFHRGSGSVSIVSMRGKNYVIFGEDFTVTNGPDYRLYLVPEFGIETESRFKAVKSRSHMIGKVKQFSGMQLFEIPQSVALNGVSGIVIWCEAFSQFISTADVR